MLSRLYASSDRDPVLSYVDAHREEPAECLKVLDCVDKYHGDRDALTERDVEDYLLEELGLDDPDAIPPYRLQRHEQPSQHEVDEMVGALDGVQYADELPAQAFEVTDSGQELYVHQDTGQWMRYEPAEVEPDEAETDADEDAAETVEGQWRLPHDTRKQVERLYNRARSSVPSVDTADGSWRDGLKQLATPPRMVEVNQEPGDSGDGNGAGEYVQVDPRTGEEVAYRPSPMRPALEDMGLNAGERLKQAYDAVRSSISPSYDGKQPWMETATVQTDTLYTGDAETINELQAVYEESGYHRAHNEYRVAGGRIRFHDAGSLLNMLSGGNQQIVQLIVDGTATPEEIPGTDLMQDLRPLNTELKDTVTVTNGQRNRYPWPLRKRE